MSSKPPWWRAFDKLERAVGKPLEDVVASPTYVDVMLLGMKVQRAIGGAVFGVARRGVGKALHAAQVPTRGDVRSLSRQITVLTREVRALKAAAEQQGDGAAKPAPKRRTPPRRRAGGDRG